MTGNPLVHVRDKAGKYSVLLEEAGNPGSGCSLLSVSYSPAGYSLQPRPNTAHQYVTNMSPAVIVQLFSLSKSLILLLKINETEKRTLLVLRKIFLTFFYILHSRFRNLSLHILPILGTVSMTIIMSLL